MKEKMKSWQIYKPWRLHYIINPEKKCCDNVILYLQQSKSALKLKKKIKNKKYCFAQLGQKKYHGK